MKKLLLTLAAVLALGMSGCDLLKKNQPAEEQQQKDDGGNTPAHQHSFAFDSFVWTLTPGNYTAKAKYVCAADSAEELHDATMSKVDAQHVDPRCGVAGKDVWKAAYDGHEETKDETLTALNHSLVHHDATASTTESDGMLEHYTCEHCGAYFNADQEEVELATLVVPKLYSTWNGAVDFAKYCTNGSTEERVGASVEGGKLRLTMLEESHYGEYRPAQVYKITKEANRKYSFSLSGVSFSEGVASGRLVIFIQKIGGDRACLGDYYWSDANYQKMDITGQLADGDNYFQLIIQCVFGNDNDNKKDCYAEISSFVLNYELGSGQFATQELNIDEICVGMQRSHITSYVENGQLVISTVGCGDTWGGDILPTEWTTAAFENSYVELTIAEINKGAVGMKLFFGESDYYVAAGLSGVGTHRIRLASMNCEGQTGQKTFRMFIYIEGGTDVTIKISAIRFLQHNPDQPWNGAVNFEEFAFSGTADRVSASVVNNKLRLTKFGDYHYGEFVPDTGFVVNKEDGKQYTMTLSGVEFSDNFAQKTINVFYKVNGGDRAFLATFNPDSPEMDFTSVLADGQNRVQIIFQLVLGPDGTITGYVDIASMTLNIK